MAHPPLTLQEGGAFNAFKLIITNDYQQFLSHFEKFLAHFQISDVRPELS